MFGRNKYQPTDRELVEETVPDGWRVDEGYGKDGLFLDIYHVSPGRGVQLDQHETLENCFCEPKRQKPAPFMVIYKHRNISKDDAVNEANHRKEISDRVAARLTKEVDAEIAEEKARAIQKKADSDFVSEMGLSSKAEIEAKLKEISETEEILSRYLDDHAWAMGGWVIY